MRHYKKIVSFQSEGEQSNAKSQLIPLQTTCLHLEALQT